MWVTKSKSSVQLLLDWLVYRTSIYILLRKLKAYNYLLSVYEFIQNDAYTKYFYMTQAIILIVNNLCDNYSLFFLENAFLMLSKNLFTNF